MRLIWCLAVAMVCALAGNLVAGEGVGAVVGLLILAGLVAGLIGAVYCTYRGLRDFDWLSR